MKRKVEFGRDRRARLAREAAERASRPPVVAADPLPTFVVPEVVTVETVSDLADALDPSVSEASQSELEPIQPEGS
jgi:hypothetical protein